MNRQSLGDIALSHVVLETTDLERAIKFYTEALGLSFVGEFDGEHFFAFPNHQLIGVKPVLRYPTAPNATAEPFTSRLMSTRMISIGCWN